MRKGRARRGRTYEVKLPNERYKNLTGLFKKKFQNPDQLSLFPEFEEAKFDNIALVDVLHYLMGLAEAEESLPIDFIFGSPIKREIRGFPVYTAGFNLSS